MLRLKTLLASFLAVFLVSTNASAGYSSAAVPDRIDIIWFAPDGNNANYNAYALIHMPDHIGNPACGTANPVWLVPLFSTYFRYAFYKNVYQTIVAAKIAGKRVVIGGAGVCNEFAGYETMTQIQVTD